MIVSSVSYTRLETGVLIALGGSLLGILGVGLFLADPLVILAAGLALPAALGLAAVGRRPLVFYAVVLLCFALQARFTPEVTVLELTFLALLLAYLSGYGLRALYAPSSTRERDAVSLAVGFLVLYAGVSASLGLLRGNPVSLVARESVNHLALLLFFPTRKLVAHQNGARTVILLIVAFFGLSAAGRNLFSFVAKADNALYVWQLMQGRVAVNEMLLYAGSVFSMGGVLWFSRRSVQGVALLSAVLCVSGLVLTQYRAYYVTLLLALVLLAVLTGPEDRKRLLAVYLSIGVGLTGVLLVALGPRTIIVAAGLLDRFSSIGQAGKTDLSLMSRILETREVLGFAWQSPIVGHGFGHEFGFYDPNYNYTWVKSFVHNAYLAVFMKGGLVGLGLLLWAWLGTLGTAWTLIWKTPHQRDRLLSAIVFSTLGPLLLVALTSPAFSTLDVFVLYAVLWGTVAGLRDRLMHPDR